VKSLPVYHIKVITHRRVRPLTSVSDRPFLPYHHC